MRLLQLLAPRAIVDGAAEVGLFTDGSSANRTGCAHGVLAQNGFIATRLSKEIAFRISSALLRHDRKDMFQGRVHLLYLRFGEVTHFSSGMDFCCPQDVLQHTVSQAGNALPGREKLLC